MQRQLIEQFMQQTQIAAHVCARDAGTRIVAASMMALVCTMAGFWIEAAAITLLLLGSEAFAYPINRRGAEFKSGVTERMALRIWLVNMTSLMPYLAYGVVISHSDSLPMILCGYIWIFGILLNVSNATGNLSLYNWTLMVPTFWASFMMLLNVAGNATFPAPTAQWGVTALLLLIYSAHAFLIMKRQRNSYAALARAKKEASNRNEVLSEMARNDTLTGLMNRKAFQDALDAALKDSQSMTIIVLDLEGFKPINDSYGHAAGDTVICAIADRLTDMAEVDGLVARIGGDEFAVAIADLGGTARAQAFGDRIANIVRIPIAHEHRKLIVGACIGVAQQGRDMATAVDLLSGADQAMELSRQDPDHRAIVFDKNAFPVRVTLDDRALLLAAMQSGEIVPYYQPKVCIASGKIIGLEALSRWQHPERGLLSPMYFLPMITELGLHREFMLHTAAHVLDDIQTLVSDELDPGQVSINLPEVTLATVSGRAELFQLIDRFPHLRHHLTFEITEDVFIEHSGDIIRESIDAFHRAGVRISLDDFGTGFASFQHLRELKIDELKLDTRFVNDLGTDPAATVLVDGFLTIGNGLGVQVVAEGVEHEMQLEILRKMGCRYVQGYYFGAAVPFSETHLRLMIADANTSSAHRREVDVA